MKLLLPVHHYVLLFNLICGLFLASAPLTIDNANAATSAQEHQRIEHDAIARSYLEACRRENKDVPLGLIGWDVVESYWQSVSELKATRARFEKYDEALGNILLRDDEYRQARAAVERSSGYSRNQAIMDFKEVKYRVSRRLQETDQNYRAAREKRNTSLKDCNLKTLEYMINDYAVKKKIFPIAWIESQPNYVRQKKQTNASPLPSVRRWKKVE